MVIPLFCRFCDPWIVAKRCLPVTPISGKVLSNLSPTLCRSIYLLSMFYKLSWGQYMSWNDQWIGIKLLLFQEFSSSFSVLTVNFNNCENITSVVRSFIPTWECIDCIESCAAAKTVIDEAKDRSVFEVPQLKAHFTNTFIEVNHQSRQSTSFVNLH